MSECIICGNEIISGDSFINDAERWMRIKCKVCGQFRITLRLIEEYYYGLLDRHVYSGAIREHNEKGRTDFLVTDLEELRDSVSVPETPIESIDKILLYFKQITISFNVGIKFKTTDYSIAYATSYEEFLFFLRQAVKMGYLEEKGQEVFRLDTQGWKRIAELSQNEVKSNQAFVAMWFHNDLKDIYKNGIKPALEQTGYIPIRLDEEEYNEKIDDAIIAQIRKSGLLIADFTGESKGVYFEAGFAMGLGIPIIWTCRDTDIESVHFDTRQYNHIPWKDAEDLKQRLINRIEATLPNKSIRQFSRQE